jgi:hypothetical protein
MVWRRTPFCDNFFTSSTKYNFGRIPDYVWELTNRVFIWTGLVSRRNH